MSIFAPTVKEVNELAVKIRAIKAGGITDYSQFNKLLNDFDNKYWKVRCKLAEKYISESPCDPDINEEQLTAYQEWQEFIKE